MIISPFNNTYSSAIKSCADNFTGYQIALSFSLPANVCTYDKIGIINDLLQKINSGNRRINRRANIDSFMVIISHKFDRTTLCTVLVRYQYQLLEKTAYARISVISDMVCAVDANAIVFTPYTGLSSDLQKFHLIQIAGDYSINNVSTNKFLEVSDCAEF